MTYGTPLSVRTTALARASGNAGPSCHGARLPLATVVDSTLVVALPPLAPPIRYRLLPLLNVPAAVRPDGSDSSVGLLCHGMMAPAGAGQGSDSFAVGHRL